LAHPVDVQYIAVCVFACICECSWREISRVGRRVCVSVWTFARSDAEARSLVHAAPARQLGHSVSVMPNSHRPPVLSVSFLVCRCELGITYRLLCAGTLTLLCDCAIYYSLVNCHATFLIVTLLSTTDPHPRNGSLARSLGLSYGIVL